MSKISLNFNSAFDYVKDHIIWGNTLSALIMKEINFREGCFFTLLPNNANFEHIEDFKSGGILPPACPVIKFPNGKGSYQLKPNTKELLVEFIKKFLLIDSSNLCIAEDVIRSPSDSEIKETGLCNINYHEEVYYLLTKNCQSEEIKSVIQQANAIYHLLIVLTRHEDGLKLELDDKNFDKLIKNINFIVCGAYDGEGYIIWEKNE